MRGAKYLVQKQIRELFWGAALAGKAPVAPHASPSRRGLRPRTSEVLGPPLLLGKREALAPRLKADTSVPRAQQPVRGLDQIYMARTGSISRTSRLAIRTR